MSKNKINISNARTLLDCILMLREVMKDLDSIPSLENYQEGLWQGVGHALESFSAVLEDLSETEQPFFDFGYAPETEGVCRLATDGFLVECRRLLGSEKDIAALPAAAMAVRASTIGLMLAYSEDNHRGPEKVSGIDNG